MNNKEKRLLEIIYKNSFQYSAEAKFKLASGKQSNYYINCKTTTLDPEGMNLIGEIIFDRVAPLNIQALGGLSLGADPLAMATALISRQKGKSINPFIVRKAVKEHGTGAKIEGNIKAGDRVVILEDVITTGQSTLKAVEKAQESGLIIVLIIALVDRQEGGRQELEKLGLTVESIFTKSQLMEIYNNDKL